jgi:AAA domain/UvrD-like helicase C-terminal domain/ATP-dependent RecD-like DNA helicase SH3 domain
MSKRLKTENDNSTITTITIKLNRYTQFGKYNYAYFGVPVTKGTPSGQPIRIKFTNMITPDDLDLAFNANKSIIIAQIKVFKSVNTVVAWRFESDALHQEASRNQLYNLSYYYKFKADAIDALNNYNKAIVECHWITGKVPCINTTNIDSDPWYLIEWEHILHDLGLSDNSKKHFTLKHCDAIGMSLNLNPNLDSRLLQYCISSMEELCYKYGSTIIYTDPYITFTTDQINASEFNITTKTRVAQKQIFEISKKRNDYFFIGRTELHNHKLFIASRKLWDAQNFIINKLRDLAGQMNTPYYAERELLIAYVKGKQPIRQIGFDVIHSLISKKLWYNQAVNKCIDIFMDQFNIKSMDDIQKKAIHTAFNESISIVSGGPGRGKSSCVLKSILYIMNELYNIGTYDAANDMYHIDSKSLDKDSRDVKIEDCDVAGRPIRTVHVVSFTGKAVSKIKEVLYPQSSFNIFEPMTIHRLLMRCKKFKWLRKAPAVIVIDEVSMVSDNLFYKLLKNFKNIKKIIFLGDVDQLPPIQEGDLLSELILSRCFPVTRLVKNYRQGAGSGLPTIADRIIGRESKRQNLSRIHGGWDHAFNIPTKKQKDHITDPDSIFGGCDDCELFGYSKFHSEDDIFDDIANKVTEIRDTQDIKVMIDCVVLTAKRVEVAKLNAKLQSAFMKDYSESSNASGNLTHYYEGIKFTFITGDRVMYLENDYIQNTFNGDVGIVTDVDAHSKQLMIQLPDAISDTIGLLDHIQPAYSLTTHKAQGSEYKIVIIYISDNAELLHVDQWLYTAFTRARQKVYIYGYNHEIVATVLREMKYRRTFLKHRLQLKFSRSLNDFISDELQNTPQ